MYPILYELIYGIAIFHTPGSKQCCVTGEYFVILSWTTLSKEKKFTCKCNRNVLRSLIFKNSGGAIINKNNRKWHPCQKKLTWCICIVANIPIFEYYYYYLEMYVFFYLKNFAIISKQIFPYKNRCIQKS